jgi:hypothetical protein
MATRVRRANSGDRVSRMLIPMLVAALIAAGCSGGDTSLYVRNDSSQAWYLRVARLPRSDSSLWVVKVGPGADAFALSWDGGDTVPVSILGLDYSVVGVSARLRTAPALSTEPRASPDASSTTVNRPARG